MAARFKHIVFHICMFYFNTLNLQKYHLLARTCCGAFRSEESVVSGLLAFILVLLVISHM